MVQVPAEGGGHEAGELSGEGECMGGRQVHHGLQVLRKDILRL